MRRDPLTGKTSIERHGNWIGIEILSTICAVIGEERAKTAAAVVQKSSAECYSTDAIGELKRKGIQVETMANPTQQGKHKQKAREKIWRLFFCSSPVIWMNGNSERGEKERTSTRAIHSFCHSFCKSGGRKRRKRQTADAVVAGKNQDSIIATCFPRRSLSRRFAFLSHLSFYPP